MSVSTPQPPETTTAKQEIFLILQRGMVQEIVGDIPSNLQMIVLDYDVEGIDPQCLQISPLDGEAC